VDALNVSDDAKMGVQKAVSDAKIAVPKAGSDLPKKQGEVKEYEFDVTCSTIPYPGIGVLQIWCTPNCRILHGTCKMARHNLWYHCNSHIPLWYAVTLQQPPPFLWSNLSR
jgi:hypothetical protein